MKLAEVSIRRPVLATVMIGVLLVFGTWVYPNIGVELMPDVDLPFVTVTVIYPGASPETVESKVVDKLEEALSTINGLKALHSQSMENVGFLGAEFELEVPIAQAMQDVRDKVGGVMSQLPDDIETPVVEKFDLNALPILSLAVAGPQSVQELTRIADKEIKQRLQVISGVGGVDIVGGQEREFQVFVDPARLGARYLTVHDVMGALAAQNIEIPGGRIETKGQELVIKTHGQVASIEELGDIVITSVEGAPVRVRDVARLVDGAAEKRSHASLNGQSAVALQVRKQSGANIVATAHAVKTEIEQLQTRLPAGVVISMPKDSSVFIENSIGDVKFDMIYGALLAILIIFLFLRDWRATFISALALPTSVVASFGFMKLMNFTFNNMTMLALSLSIGILIDDAIVVIESINRHLQMGKKPMQAAMDATSEIGLAVLATTASIVAVFVPVATMKGLVGRFFFQFGMTVAFAVAVSLFVAFTLTPSLSARMLAGHTEHHSRFSRAVDGFLGRVDALYRKLLAWALAHRGVTLLVAALTLVGALALSPLMRIEFFPETDQGALEVSMELPTGTDINTTTALFDQVSGELRAVPGIRETFSTIGAGSQGEVNRGSILVNLVKRHERTYTQKEGIVFVRQHLSGRDDATYSVKNAEEMAGVQGFALQFNIRGNDLDRLRAAANAMTIAMRQAGGYVDVDTTWRGGKPEVGVTIDRGLAADLGVPVAMAASTIRTFFAGEKATDLSLDGDRIDVQVKLDAPFRDQPSDILDLSVRSNSGTLVPMESVASIDPGTGPAKIERRDRQRQVTVTANLEGKVLGDAMGEIEAMAQQIVPSDLKTAWDGYGQIMRESFESMMGALILAIILVYLILAAQFESFMHPLTIMLSLPLSLIGALGALLLTGTTMNVATFIGIIMLMGLVTKNAILLVDYANHLRLAGQDTTAALLQAGPVRLRPILMTTFAMIFGMLPVALALSEGSEIRAPMAVAVIGGLITSTMLTLVVVPVAYSLLDQFAAHLRSRKSIT